jgi:hypothetical protein
VTKRRLSNAKGRQLLFSNQKLLVQMFSSILQKEATHYNIGNANDARLHIYTLMHWRTWGNSQERKGIYGSGRRALRIIDEVRVAAGFERGHYSQSMYR